MKLPFRILVLDDDDAALAGIVELLRDAGYVVTGATTYDAAKRLLALDSYDLLITDIRLRGFNGLHLVRQSHRDRPEMGIIIISGYDEPMIEVEAGRYGAEFVRKPIKPPQFLQSVRARSQTCAGSAAGRASASSVAFASRRTDAPLRWSMCATAGLRLEVPEGGNLPDVFDVEIAGIGLHLPVEAVWTQRLDEGGAMMYGAALATEETPAARTWRAIVDRLSA
jgi:CheY-like chemotaxis protein